LRMTASACASGEVRNLGDRRLRTAPYRLRRRIPKAAEGASHRARRTGTDHRGR
jgi:hypothetical protein